LSRRERVLLRWEIFSVFAVSLGASGVSAFVSLIGSLTARHSLASQSVTLNGSQAPGRPLLDLSLQLVSIASGVAPVVLVFYLLARSGDGAKSIGVDRTQPLRDFLRGAGLAALIGGSGLGLYFIAYKSGIALNVVAENEPNVWWRFPVLLLSALQNGLLEEVLVTGYLLTRLRRLGVRPRTRLRSVRRYAALITCTRASGAFSVMPSWGSSSARCSCAGAVRPQ
jgi:membrane protease YdiL (CAAX protease family)